MAMIRALGEDGKYLFYDDEKSKPEVIGSVKVIKDSKLVEEPKVKLSSKLRKAIL